MLASSEPIEASDFPSSLCENGVVLDREQRWIADLLRDVECAYPASSASSVKQDQVLVALARLVLPALEDLDGSKSLFVSYLLSAARLHLAQVYVGLHPRVKVGALAPWQEQRARELFGR
jgi:hypothetical protein